MLGMLVLDTYTQSRPLLVLSDCYAGCSPSLHPLRTGHALAGGIRLLCCRWSFVLLDYSPLTLSSGEVCLNLLDPSISRLWGLSRHPQDMCIWISHTGTLPHLLLCCQTADAQCYVIHERALGTGEGGLIARVWTIPVFNYLACVRAIAGVRAFVCSQVHHWLCCQSLPGCISKRLQDFAALHALICPLAGALKRTMLVTLSSAYVKSSSCQPAGLV